MSAINSGSITFTNSKHFVFKWTLEDFHKSLESLEDIYSPNCHIYDNAGRQVELYLQLNSRTEDSNLSCFTIFNDSEKEVNVTWRWVSIYQISNNNAPFKQLLAIIHNV